MTLTADIGPCVRGGLIIGANDITLDLGGHRVFGKSRTGDGIGIAVPSHTGVTIRNGTVAQFDAGVVIDGGSANLVENLTANFNQGGARSDFGDGILISDSSGNTVQNNNVTNNGPFSGVSLLGVTEDNEILSNVVTSNGVPATGNDGIRIEGPGAANNLVQGNTVTGSTLDGIAVFRGVVTPGGPSLNNGNRIIGNAVTANGFGHLGARPGDGIRVFPGPTDTVIQSNSVADNAGNGIIVGLGATSNDILTNTATGNARAAASLFDLNDANPSCDANVWASNTFGTASQACIS
ncbi:MAG: right-handed parallel beta-helix repeat-containing protein [Acidimicrobiales bacterium]